MAKVICPGYRDKPEKAPLHRPRTRQEIRARTIQRVEDQNRRARERRSVAYQYGSHSPGLRFRISKAVPILITGTAAAVIIALPHVMPEKTPAPISQPHAYTTTLSSRVYDPADQVTDPEIPQPTAQSDIDGIETKSETKTETSEEDLSNRAARSTQAADPVTSKNSMDQYLSGETDTAKTDTDDDSTEETNTANPESDTDNTDNTADTNSNTSPDIIEPVGSTADSETASETTPKTATGTKTRSQTGDPYYDAYQNVSNDNPGIFTPSVNGSADTQASQGAIDTVALDAAARIREAEARKKQEEKEKAEQEALAKAEQEAQAAREAQAKAEQEAEAAKKAQAEAEAKIQAQQAQNNTQATQKTTQAQTQNTSNGSYYRADVPLSAGEQQALYNACAENNVPINLALGVINLESNFTSSATNGTTYGYMQLHKKYFPVFNMTPVQNIQAGVKLLGDNYKKYGNWDAALTAYNVGHDNGSRSYANRVKGLARNWGWDG